MSEQEQKAGISRRALLQQTVLAVAAAGLAPGVIAQSRGYDDMLVPNFFKQGSGVSVG